MMLFSLAAAAAGCSRHDGLDRAQVVGFLSAAGEPLAAAGVRLLPVAGSGTPGQGAIGASDAAGKFEVVSSRQDDAGVPPGEYTVVVSRFANPDGQVLGPDIFQADHPNARETIPAPYSTESSPLKVTISKEGGEVKVDLPVKPRDPRKPRGKS
ncbi:hypothetical protein Pan44_27740 [Caulifigura coniformis]|uniref:Carboxypeptidase regulatory-like domain-containing protein n=2 Tax=Caulifigura coniformis TaxID=2527983 RepID=A0A517SF54_9PLAN|nr:hypothetical protein Pan44_27740 [Caulifigura coniformis]